MKRRRWIVLGLLLLTAGVGFAFLDPDARLRGWIGGEPFFQGRSATAWSHDLGQADEVKSTATRAALSEGKGEALPVCTWLLERSPNPVVRARAADALKQMGAEGEPTGPALLKALDDPDPVVRGVALQAVEALAPRLPADALPRLIARFPEVESIRIVAKFGPAAAEATPRLVELIKHGEPTVRFQAVRALGKIGPTSIPLVPEFLRLLANDPNDKVREISAEVIGQLGPASAQKYPDVVPALAKALNDPAWNVRRDAVRSLGQLGSLAKPVLASVKAREKDDDERVRTAATRAVRQIEGEGN